MVLSRMIQPIEPGGVAYFEFVPRQLPGGQIRGTEISIYTTGEFMTATLRRVLLPVLADQSRTFLDRLVTGEKDRVRDFPQVGRAGELLNEGKPAEALAIYKQLEAWSGRVSRPAVIREGELPVAFWDRGW